MQLLKSKGEENIATSLQLANSTKLPGHDHFHMMMHYEKTVAECLVFMMTARQAHHQD